MAGTEVWVRTGSGPALAVDVPAVLDNVSDVRFPWQVEIVSSGYVQLVRDELTVNLRGMVTAEGFEITNIGVVTSWDSQRLVSLLYQEGRPLITDLTPSGFLDGMVQALEALRTDPGIRIFGGGAIGHDVIMGGLGNDTLGGGNGHDTVIGGQGGDDLHGGWGRDLLAGWAGDDRLAGDGGRDTMTGGQGADRFIFASAGDAYGDKITDFDRAEGDLIDLSQFDTALTLSATAAFHGVAGEIRLLSRAAGTVVQGDMDGDGLADMTFLVKAVQDMTGEDLIL